MATMPKTHLNRRAIPRRNALLVPRPDFISGAARMMDVGGRYTSYRLSQIPSRSDADALAGDWGRVGEALNSAMERVRDHQDRLR